MLIPISVASPVVQILQVVPGAVVALHPEWGRIAGVLGIVCDARETEARTGPIWFSSGPKINSQASIQRRQGAVGLPYLSFLVEKMLKTFLLLVQMMFGNLRLRHLQLHAVRGTHLDFFLGLGRGAVTFSGRAFALSLTHVWWPLMVTWRP